MITGCVLRFPKRSFLFFSDATRGKLFFYSSNCADSPRVPLQWKIYYSRLQNLRTHGALVDFWEAEIMSISVQERSPPGILKVYFAQVVIPALLLKDRREKRKKKEKGNERERESFPFPFRILSLRPCVGCFVYCNPENFSKLINLVNWRFRHFISY